MSSKFWKHWGDMEDKSELDKILIKTLKKEKKPFKEKKELEEKNTETPRSEIVNDIKSEVDKKPVEKEKKSAPKKTTSKTKSSK